MSAIQKFKIVNIILNKSILDDNVINIILQHYWNILDYKKKGASHFSISTLCLAYNDKGCSFAFSSSNSSVSLNP